MLPSKMVNILTARARILLPFLLATSLNCHAVIEAHSFDNDLERERYQTFIEEMRCPKCQNQNLAGSDSPISADLRRELYEMIKLGKSDKEITDYMVDRYGEFILYRPKVTPLTYVLWGAPCLLLLIGSVVVVLIIRQRRLAALSLPPASLSQAEQDRLQKLLQEVDSNNVNKVERS